MLGALSCLSEGYCHLSVLGCIKLRVIEEWWPRGQLDLVVSDGSSRALRASHHQKNKQVKPDEQIRARCK